MPRFIGGGIKNTEQEISDGVNATQKIINIQEAIGRVVTQAWNNHTEFENWSYTKDIYVDYDGYLQIGGSVGTSISRTADNYSGTRSEIKGFIVNPNTDLAGLQGIIGSNNSGFSKAYITKHSDGTILAEKDISGKSAGDLIYLCVDDYLASGTEYRFQIDNDGDSYTCGWYDAPSYPYTSVDFDLTSAVTGATIDTTQCQGFSDVTALLAVSSGDAESPLITDSPYEWHQIWIGKELNSETVAIDILDSSDNILKSDVSDGQNISDISTEIDLKVKVSLSRVDNTNNPKLKSVSVVWLI